MTRNHAFGMRSASTLFFAGIFCLSLVTACGDSTEERLAADLDCTQIAASRSGYKPAKGSKDSVGKGAAIGAASGAAVGAASSKKSKDVVKGAAIGAAAGAGAGALKDSEDRKRAETARKAYEMEYQHCMKSKGF